MAQSNKLWAVFPLDKNVSFGNLWVLAGTLESAATKARKWLKAHGWKTELKKIESHGTVDVF